MADSAPLLYSAPQLQSMVALDPTFFWLADSELFTLYTRIVHGQHGDPAQAIRERFGARWVTIWKVPALGPLTAQLLRSGTATVAYADASYLVLDLGVTGAAAAPPR